jgi:hypothetical protein
VQINCTKVAQIFGEGATYSAIENFLRGPKRQAKKLKEENGDVVVPASAPRTPKKEKAPGSGMSLPKFISNPVTPSSGHYSHIITSLNEIANVFIGVKAGRINKPKTPTKKGSPIKKEFFFDDNDFGMGGSVGGSFNGSALTSGAEGDGEGMMDDGEFI